MKTNSFKDLIVWQKAYKLVLEIYKVTKDFPKEEAYGLVQQMRRAAVSIPSKEGFDPQVLFDPFEKEFDLPAGFVQLGNS